jgi:hypothetical protein
MPKRAHKIAKALQRKGMSEERAWRIANSRNKKKTLRRRRRELWKIKSQH